MKKLLIISSLVLGLPVLAFGGLLGLMVGWEGIEEFGKSYRIDKEYDSFADTALDRAPGKWMPQVLPGSSRNISMTYYADYEKVWVAFAFLADDLKALGKNCEELSKADVARADWPGGGPDWWPDELTNAHMEDSETAIPFQVLLCADKSPTLFAATREGKWRKGYLWSSGYDLMQ